MHLSADAARYKLMVSGAVSSPDSPGVFVTVSRGMTVLGGDGAEAGRLAAVEVSASNQTINLLISRLPEMSGYWRVPVDWIARVTGETIRLAAAAEAVYAQPQWHGS